MSSELELTQLSVFFAYFQFNVSCYSSNEVNIGYKLSKITVHSKKLVKRSYHLWVGKRAYKNYFYKSLPKVSPMPPKLSNNNFIIKSARAASAKDVFYSIIFHIMTQCFEVILVEYGQQCINTKLNQNRIHQIRLRGKYLSALHVVVS